MRPSQISRTVVAALAGLYLITSAYETLKALFWVVELPSAWHGLIRTIYIPFSPYQNLAREVLAGSSLTYESYVYVLWGPFLALSLIALVWALLGLTAKPGK